MTDVTERLGAQLHEKCANTMAELIAWHERQAAAAEREACIAAIEQVRVVMATRTATPLEVLQAALEAIRARGEDDD